MLALIGRGLSDAEIAAEHGLSPATAQKHRTNLLRKLGVAGSAKLTAYAIEHGFAPFGRVRPGPWLGPTTSRLRVGSGNSAQPAAVGANIKEPRFRALILRTQRAASSASRNPYAASPRRFEP